MQARQGCRVHPRDRMPPDLRGRGARLLAPGAARVLGRSLVRNWRSHAIEPTTSPGAHSRNFDGVCGREPLGQRRPKLLAITAKQRPFGGHDDDWRHAHGIRAIPALYLDYA